MFFMHLAMERKGLWVVAVMPAGHHRFCYFMLRPDLSRRIWAHTRSMSLSEYTRQPEEYLPQVPQGNALSNADQPADSQVGQPKPAAPPRSSAAGNESAELIHSEAKTE